MKYEDLQRRCVVARRYNIGTAARLEVILRNEKKNVYVYRLRYRQPSPRRMFNEKS